LGLVRADAVAPLVVRFAVVAVFFVDFLAVVVRAVLLVALVVALLVAVVALATDPCAPIGSAAGASRRSARRGTTGSRRIKE